MSEERGDYKKRRADVNHAAAFIKAWWFFIIFVLGAIGAMTTLWFDVQFVVRAVNPDSLAGQRVNEAIRETREDTRWCLQKLFMKPETKTEANVMACTDTKTIFYKEVHQ
jgi:hypothetical protein